MFVLISMSAVSAADLQDNNATLASDDSLDIVAVSDDSSDALEISNDEEIRGISDSDDVMEVTNVVISDFPGSVVIT